MSETPTNLFIRDARREDHARIGDLTAEAYRRIRPQLGSYEVELRDVAGHLESARVLVAALDGEVVGAITFVPGPGPLAEWEDPAAGGIRFLAVAPEAQGNGIGVALVNACIDAARRQGIPRLILHTTDAMTTAQRIYDGLGFVREADLDEEIAPGFWLRRYRLELAAD